MHLKQEHHAALVPSISHAQKHKKSRTERHKVVMPQLYCTYGSSARARMCSILPSAPTLLKPPHRSAMCICTYKRTTMETRTCGLAGGGRAFRTAVARYRMHVQPAAAAGCYQQNVQARGSMADGRLGGVGAGSSSMDQLIRISPGPPGRAVSTGSTQRRTPRLPCMRERLTRRCRPTEIRDAGTGR